MNRRSFLKKSLVASASGLAPRGFAAAQGVRRRVRPGDREWPGATAWEQLRKALQGKLQPLASPLQACVADPDGLRCQELFRNLKNPFYLQDDPALTQTSGWLDAWSSRPSAYAAIPQNAAEIAEAVRFARRYNLRLVVKGGGHSYMGNSNAPDSLLIWTHGMQGIDMHDGFVPEGAPASQLPQRAVTLGAGVIWEQAYDAVTTKAGGYVQGGGCTTVGVPGLIQGGGFGSYSKHFGLASAGLLQAEVVTADGRIRIVNAFQDPDLFWALKGGGGGTFGVVSQVTLRVQDLPKFCGDANLVVKANSDADFVVLLTKFLEFYRSSLMNPHWGESVNIAPDNTLYIGMVQAGLTEQQAKAVWQPFLAWVEKNTSIFDVRSGPNAGSSSVRHRWSSIEAWLIQRTGSLRLPSSPAVTAHPMRHLWDPTHSSEHPQTTFASDPRPHQSPNHIWWSADTGQVAFFLWDYDSVWLPASLLDHDQQPRLVQALFHASRQSTVSLHFNKGLAGAPASVVAEARNTPMNPAVCDAFALAIVCQAQGPAYPGLRGHEPDLARGRQGARQVQRAMDSLRTVAPDSGSYVSESSFFGANYKAACWGRNYDRLARIKRTYDPDCLFFVHHGVGCENWSADGFTRLT